MKPTKWHQFSIPLIEHSIFKINSKTGEIDMTALHTQIQSIQKLAKIQQSLTQAHANRVLLDLFSKFTPEQRSQYLARWVMRHQSISGHFQQGATLK